MAPPDACPSRRGHGATAAKGKHRGAPSVLVLTAWRAGASVAFAPNCIAPGHTYDLPAMRPIVQISLDVTDIPEALQTAEMALRAGVDWLEAGTPLIIAEGMHGVRALRQRFPDTPIVADLKTMDGGWLEAEL